MTNTERIQANNAKLRQSIDQANSLPDRGSTDVPKYDGEYIVTPSTETDITLATAHKLLENNVKVNKIPFAEVSNNTGGKTATIG